MLIIAMVTIAMQSAVMLTVILIVVAPHSIRVG